MQVFLSGDTRTNWQNQIMEKYPNHKFYDPRKLSDETYEKMARIEREWINKSDILFAYLNASNPYGYGTAFEIGYAVAIKKPIIYIDEKQVSSSKWIAEHLQYSFPTFEEGVEQLGKLLVEGDEFIANRIYERLENQDFTVLVYQELNDQLSYLLANKISNNEELYIKLMLASQTLPKEWYDWNLGYLLQRLNPQVISKVIKQYGDNFYSSEGVAWALGLLGNDDEEIIKFLQNQCKICVNYDAWWCAAFSLEQLGFGDAIEILKRTLVKDEWQDLNYCLENIGSRPATIGILRRINKNNITTILEKCLDSLGNLKGRKLHNVIWLLERMRINENRVIDTLISLHSRVTHGSELSHRIVEALGVIAHPKSRSLLEEDLISANYFRTRALAARGLGIIGDYKSIEKLEKALESEEHPHVISIITEALYNLKDQEKRNNNRFIIKSQWLENGMIIDESNKWYWSPEIYDKFSKSEDPENISFDIALSYLPNKIDNILDLGSGTGRFIDELLKKNLSINKIYSLDSSDEMTKYLKKKYDYIPNISVIHSTIDSIPLDNNSVEAVISSWGFPSKVSNKNQTFKELKEVYRVLCEKGIFITIGWDEDFQDEMTSVWHKFVMEDEYYYESLPEYRRRRRNTITSPRNCNLSFVKKKLKIPVKFNSIQDCSYVFGHLFGYSAGVWILENNKKEFNMNISITVNSREDIDRALLQEINN